KGFWDRKLLIAVGAAIAGFVVTSPYAVLDASRFIKQALYEGGHYSQGHAGMEGDVFFYYLSTMLRETVPVLVLSVLGVLVVFIKDWKRAVLLLVFPLLYFVFICLFTVRNERTLLPVLSFVILFAAFLLGKLATLFSGGEERAPALRAIFLFVFCGAAMYLPYESSAKQAIRLVSPNSRDLAREWIANNIPAKSKIALERYAPYIDPDTFDVVVLWELNKKDAQWFEDEGVEYIVASGWMYGRYFRAKEQYPKEYQAYQELFERYPLVKRFKLNGPDVRILRVRPR
ncbi:MAG: hypothetical protein KDD55_13795, partial [Bdellovibrionales bacterium]|nr:hypothetical protein [Bdellovibrionales bacterium]